MIYNHKLYIYYHLTYATFIYGFCLAAISFIEYGCTIFGGKIELQFFWTDHYKMWL